MQVCTIIGNLTRDPELRTTQTGLAVCTFTVAVNRPKASEGTPQADFFRVTAWRQLGELCQKFLVKGRKVCVVGAVSARVYDGSDGKARASLEITADKVEFLSPREPQATNGEDSAYRSATPYTPPPAQPGYEQTNLYGQMGSQGRTYTTAYQPDAELQAQGFTQVDDYDLPF